MYYFICYSFVDVVYVHCAHMCDVDDVLVKKTCYKIQIIKFPLAYHQVVVFKE